MNTYIKLLDKIRNIGGTKIAAKSAVKAGLVQTVVHDDLEIMAKTKSVKLKKTRKAQDDVLVQDDAAQAVDSFGVVETSLLAQADAATPAAASTAGADQDEKEGRGLLLPILAGLLGAGALAAAAGGGGGGGTPASTLTGVTAGDTDKDTKADVTGNAKPGDKVTVTFPDGSTVTTTAGADGKWAVEDTKNTPSGTIKVADSSGNTTSVTYTDKTNPNPPEVKDYNTQDVLSGTGEPGATIIVTDPSDGTTTTTTVKADGTWEIKPNPLEPGDLGGTVIAKDAAGNTSISVELNGPKATGSGEAPAAPSITNIVDSVMPDAPATLQPNQSTNDTKPTLNGTGIAGAVVKVYDKDGTVLGSTTVDNSGNWSIETKELAQGTHELSVTQTVGSQESEKGLPFPIVVDTTAPAQPAAPASYNDNAGAVQNPTSTEPTTDDATPGINVGKNLTDTPKLYVDGKEVPATYDPATGTLTPNSPLAEGPHSITYTLTDPAGNESKPSAPIAITVDTSTLAVSIDSALDNQPLYLDPIASGGLTNDTTPTLKGTTLAANTTVTIKEGTTTLGTVVSDTNGDWSFTLPTQTDGKHTYTASIPNNTVTADFVVNVDSQGPSTLPKITGAVDSVVAKTGPFAEGESSNDPTPTFSGTAGAGDTVMVYDNGTLLATVVAGADGTWIYKPTANLAEGAHDITVRSADVAGNTTAVGDTFSFKEDYSAPPSAKVQTNTEGTLSGTAEPGATVVVTEQDGTTTTVVADNSGNWSITPNPIQPGDTAGTITVIDPAGNPSPVITVEAPEGATPSTPVDMANVKAMDDVGDKVGQLASGDTTDDTQPEFSGTGATPGSVIKLYDGSTPIGSATVAADGTWKIADDTIAALPAGTHPLTLTSTEPGKTESAKSTPFNLTIASTAPNNEDGSGVNKDSLKLVDDVDPVTGEIPDNASTNDTRPVYTGTAGTPGVAGKEVAYVKVYDNGTLVGTATVGADGKFSFEMPAGAENSTHNLTVSAVNASGVEGTQTAKAADGKDSYKIDTTAPDADTAFGKPASVFLTENVSVANTDTAVADGAAINDTTPKYAGTITAAGLAAGVVAVNVYDKGVFVGTATVDQTTGKWAYEGGATGGSHAYTASAADAAGNSSAQVSGTADAAWDFSIDTDNPTAPAITQVSDNFGDDQGQIQKYVATQDNASGYTDDATPVLTGTADAGSIVTVYATDAAGKKVVVGSTIADTTTGNWTLEAANLGADGVYSLSANSKDAAGNTGAESGLYPIKLDTTAPTTFDLSKQQILDNVGDKQGPLSNGDTTDDTTPTFKGAGATPGDVITIYDNGQPIGSATVNPDGTWEVTPTTPLTPGVHNLTATDTDKAGNESAPGTPIAITVAASTGTITIDYAQDSVEKYTDNLASGDATNDTQAVLVGTVDPAFTNKTVTIKDASGATIGTTTAAADGSWSFELPVQTQGDHTYTAAAVDNTGNNKTATFALSIDTVAGGQPAVPSALVDDVGTIKGPVTQNGVTDDTTPTIAGTGAAGDVITIYDNGTPIGSTTVADDGTWSWTPPETQALGEGNHAFTVTTTDEAGNESVQSDPYLFNVDVTPPDAPTMTNSKYGEASGKAEPLSTVTIVDSQGNTITAVTDANGDWKVSDPNLEAGEKVTLYATDVAGNKGDSIPGTIGELTRSAMFGNPAPSFNVNGDGSQASTENPQLDPSVAIVDGGVNDGLIVEVFAEYDQYNEGYWNIHMRYIKNNIVIGTNMLINGEDGDFSTLNNQTQPQVTALKNGNVVVTWTSNDEYQNGYDNIHYRILTPVVNADGSTAFDVVHAEELVNSNKGNTQMNPSIATLKNGNFIIVWQSDDGYSAGGYNIYSSEFTADGQLVNAKADVLVSENTTGEQHQPTVTALNNGGYVVAWASYETDYTQNYDVMVQYFDPTGNTTGATKVANATGVQDWPHVEALDSGGFVVSYTNQMGYPEYDQVEYRAYDIKNGIAVPNMKSDTANTFDSGYQNASTVVSLIDGGYLIIWQSGGNYPPQDGNGYGIYAQRFDKKGNKIGHEFLVNDFTDGDQGNQNAYMPYPENNFVTQIDAVSQDDGTVYVSWNTGQTEGGDGSQSAVSGRVIDVLYMSQYTEMTANSTIADNQNNSDVAVLKNGHYIVVWQSNSNYPNQYDVYLQEYDSSSAPVGEERRVNNNVITGQQTAPKIAVLEDGSYVITWSAENVDNSSTAILTKHFTQEGSVVAGENEVIANYTLAGEQRNSEIVALDDGGYMLVWESQDAWNQGYWNIYATRFDNQGNPVYGSASPTEGEFRVNVLTSGDQLNSQVIKLESGKVVVVYQSDDSYSNGYNNIWQATYDPTTAEWTSIADPKMVNKTTGGQQVRPAAAALSDGSYVISWQSEDSYQNGGNNIYMQRYDATGKTLGKETLVNTQTTGAQLDPHVVSMGDDGYVVFWSSDDSWQEGYYNIHAQKYSNDGTTIGSEFTVNDRIAQDQSLVSADYNPVTGDLVATWTSQYGDGAYNDSVQVKLIDPEFVGGGDIRMNTFTEWNQQTPSLTTLANGTVVSVWESGGWPPQDGNGYGVFMQRFTPDGVKIEVETRVNKTTAQDQNNAVVEALTGGGYVVAWTSQDDWNQGYWNIYMQQYDANGVKVNDEYRVNTTTSNTQLNPEIVALDNGGFAISWDSQYQAASYQGGYDTYMRVFTAAGEAGVVSDEIRANSTTGGDQVKPAMTLLNDGNFVTVWQSDDGWANGQTNIWAQVFKADGSKVSGQTNFRVNTETANQQTDADVTALSDGGFIVTWASDDGWNNGQTNIHAQRYDNTYKTVGEEITLNSYTTGQQVTPAITLLSDGDFVAVWASGGNWPAQDGDQYGIFGQRFNADGTKDGNEFIVNIGTTSNQYDPAVTATENGGFVVAWTSTTGDGSGTSVQSRFFTNPVADINGTAGVDNLTGTDAGEKIYGMGGADTIAAGAGNDTIIVPDATFNSIDGGTGADAVVFTGASLNVNLPLLNITNVEKIAVDEAQAASIKLSYQEILNTSDTDTLTIYGGSDDSVQVQTLLGVAATANDVTVDGLAFKAYNLGGTADYDLYIQSGIVVSFVA